MEENIEIIFWATFLRNEVKKISYESVLENCKEEI